jgi:hypothetical protein
MHQKFTVQVTTLPYSDDITRFDGSYFRRKTPAVDWTKTSKTIDHNKIKYKNRKGPESYVPNKNKLVVSTHIYYK